MHSLTQLAWMNKKNDSILLSNRLPIWGTTTFTMVIFIGQICWLSTSAHTMHIHRDGNQAFSLTFSATLPREVISISNGKSKYKMIKNMFRFYRANHWNIIKLGGFITMLGSWIQLPNFMRFKTTINKEKCSWPNIQVPPWNSNKDGISLKELYTY